MFASCFYYLLWAKSYICLIFYLYNQQYHVLILNSRASAIVRVQYRNLPHCEELLGVCGTVRCVWMSK